MSKENKPTNRDINAYTTLIKHREREKERDNKREREKKGIAQRREGLGEFLSKKFHSLLLQAILHQHRGRLGRCLSL